MVTRIPSGVGRGEAFHQGGSISNAPTFKGDVGSDGCFQTHLEESKGKGHT